MIDKRIIYLDLDPTGTISFRLEIVADKYVTTTGIYIDQVGRVHTDIQLCKSMSDQNVELLTNHIIQTMEVSDYRFKGDIDFNDSAYEITLSSTTGMVDAYNPESTILISHAGLGIAQKVVVIIKEHEFVVEQSIHDSVFSRKTYQCDENARVVTVIDELKEDDDKCILKMK